MTFTTQVLLAFFFWPILLTQVRFRTTGADPNTLKALKIVDHYLPLSILIVDYIVSNPVFVLRHVVFSFGYGLIYTFTNMIISLAQAPTYKIMDWQSPEGVLIPLLLVLLFPLLHIALFYLTRYRLQKDPFKNQTILKVL